ncbi:Glycosyltransferase-like protein [Photobacterium angustum S14]|uniref:Glycosyltransferase-like protein n=1 Tax=Photobacterium angustum (strain S14 / CCUG 15956) TaxID=314292 RepID=Q1ZRK6_PHOAS|nr:glycosyltransferase family 4 protein [Photobacterium angustum]EAS65321.1 Glycosyltransferase-like protein [Photobacterium angustum S14]
MNIWLVMSGEPLALYGERPHRVGILSQMLADRGHQVTWWTTTFDHQKKEYLFDETKNIKVSKNLDMVFLHSETPYERNISIKRIINHKKVASEFSKKSIDKAKPDLIFCAYPTIDLAYEVTKFGKENNIKTIIDIRDLWPDIFVDAIPKSFKPFGSFLLSPLIKKSKYIFSNCDAITAVSQGYLNWSCKYSNRNLSDIDKVFPLGYKKSESDTNTMVNYAHYHKIGIDKSKIIIWFVGTFGQTYDLLPIISAAKKLEKNANVQFVFTGDGEKSSEWKKAAEGLSNVIFTGWVDKEGLSFLSSIASIGLMAYRKGAPQGLPNKIFEYLASGIPILSSLETETKDVLSKYEVGLTYDALDYNDCINKLDSLISNTEKLSQMKSNALSVFEKEFSADIVYSNIIKYFESFKE